MDIKELREISEREYSLNFTEIELQYGKFYRHYHTLEHVCDMLNFIENKFGKETRDKLFIPVLFHDIVYEPGATDNEEASIVFLKRMQSYRITNEKLIFAHRCIMRTKTISPIESFEKLEEIMAWADIRALLEYNIPQLILYERKIFKEFQYSSIVDYKKSRIQFLENTKLIMGKNLPAIDFLIEYIENYEPSVAVYAGSFNPLHNGHIDILLKADKIFDKVIVAKGINSLKENQCKWSIPDIVSKHFEVLHYSNLLSDFLDSIGKNTTLVRGIRNGFDLEQEKSICRVLEDIARNEKHQIVHFLSSRETEHVSSTLVRDIVSYDHELALKYVPEFKN